MGKSLLKFWIELWNSYEKLNGNKILKSRIMLYNKYIDNLYNGFYHNHSHVIFCLQELENYENYKKDERRKENKGKKENKERNEKNKRFLSFKKYKLEEELDKEEKEILTKVGFAILFHDFCCPFDLNSEEKSAKIAEEYLKTEMCKEWINDIKRIIISTKQEHKPKDYSEKLMHDIDYAILGQDSKIFNEYEIQIKKEANANGIDGKNYLEKRLEFVENTLAGEIFYLDFFKNKYEEKAKENLIKLKEKIEEELKNYMEEK